MIGPLLSGAVGLASEWLAGRRERSKVKTEAEAAIKKHAATSISDWERVMATNTANSYKDEAWTYMFIALIVAHFIPWEPLQSAIATGWDNLEKTPIWFQGAVGVSIAASFGVRGWNAVRTLGK